MNSSFFLVCCALNFASLSSPNTGELGSAIPAERICKPGPPLKGKPGKINCLIIGDSISIGYTPWVAKMLGNDYQVQHAPWDHDDGGALDSKYGLQCLKLFLLTAMLEPTSYDVIIFNFGMHDINYNSKLPEEYTSPNDYTINLKEIKSILLSTGAKLGYVFTTAIPYNNTLNVRIKQYNSLASRVMKEYPAVETADLYSWVIEGCQNNCIVVDEDLLPHFTGKGYKYISEKVKEFILELAQPQGVDEKQFSEGREKSLAIRLSSNTFQRGNLHQMAAGKSVPCKNMFGDVVTVCPHNSTCCSMPFSKTSWGCCLTPKAVPCGDGNHCCPVGYLCKPDCLARKTCSCRKT